MPPQASEDYYKTLQRLQVVMIAAARTSWAGMGADFDRSWPKVAPRLVTVLSAAQLAAAQAGQSFVPDLLEETGQLDEPEAVVRPQAFSGVAADGRSLLGLLRSSVVHAKEASGRGSAPQQALDAGGSWLDGLVQTAVSDAGRGSVQANVAVRKDIGFVRQVVPGCCGRCAILAGRWYRFDAGFARHPRCRCYAVPATESKTGGLATDPNQLFSKGLVRGLTKDQQTRLAAGEDRNKVINASRDMWRATLTDQKAPGVPDAVIRRGLEDIFASTRSRVEALTEMQAQGYLAAA
jgi:hypothetical protein